MRQLFDLLPVLLFFILYKFYMDLPGEVITGVSDLLPFLTITPNQPTDAIYLATLVAMLATLIQVGAVGVISRRLEKLPLVMLGLLIVFGGATLLLKDPLFIQWKPTVINWLFGLVFLGSQFIGERPLVERIMSVAIDIPEQRFWRQLNLTRVGFFAVFGLANIIVAAQIYP